MTVPASCVMSRPGLFNTCYRQADRHGRPDKWPGGTGAGGQTDGRVAFVDSGGGQNYLGIFVPPCFHSTMCTLCTALHSCFIICIVLIHITVHVAVHHCTLQLYTVSPNYVCRLKLCNLQPVLGAATWPWHPLVGGWEGNFTQPPDSINSPYPAAASLWWVHYTLNQQGKRWSAGMHSSQCQCTIPYFNNGLKLDPSLKRDKTIPWHVDLSTSWPVVLGTVVPDLTLQQPNNTVACLGINWFHTVHCVMSTF